MKFSFKMKIKDVNMFCYFYQHPEDNMFYGLEEGLVKEYPDLKKYQNLSYLMWMDKTNGRSCTQYADKILEEESEIENFINKTLKEYVKEKKWLLNEASK